MKERLDTMNKLHESVDYSNLKFKYVGPTKDVSFHKLMESKELFEVFKNNWIKFDDELKKHELFLNKLNNVKIGKKTPEQEEIITNLKDFYMSREDVFFKDYIEMYIDAGQKAKQDKTKGTGLKILTSKQMLQRLPIALEQVQAGNNWESLLNEIRQIVYSLYQ